MKITLDKLESLDGYQKRALIPMLNLIFGYVGTSRWPKEGVTQETIKDPEFDKAFTASLDYFRQAFYGDDLDFGKDMIIRSRKGDKNSYRSFMAGSDMVVDRYMRSEFAHQLMTIDNSDIPDIAKYCNPHWNGVCPWNYEWEIRDVDLTPLGASITRAFNFAYMASMEGGNNGER